MFRCHLPLQGHNWRNLPFTLEGLQLDSLDEAVAQSETGDVNSIPLRECLACRNAIVPGVRDTCGPQVLNCFFHTLSANAPSSSLIAYMQPVLSPLRDASGPGLWEEANATLDMRSKHEIRQER